MKFFLVGLVHLRKFLISQWNNLQPFQSLLLITYQCHEQCCDSGSGSSSEFQFQPDPTSVISNMKFLRKCLLNYNQSKRRINQLLYFSTIKVKTKFWLFIWSFISPGSGSETNNSGFITPVMRQTLLNDVSTSVLCVQLIPWENNRQFPPTKGIMNHLGDYIYYIIYTVIYIYIPTDLVIYPLNMINPMWGGISMKKRRFAFSQLELASGNLWLAVGTQILWHFFFKR